MSPGLLGFPLYIFQQICPQSSLASKVNLVLYRTPSQQLVCFNLFLPTHRSSISSPSLSTMNNNLHLTLGVELEFIAVYRPGTFDSIDPHLTKDQVDGSSGYVSAAHAIYYFFNRQGLRATGFEGDDDDELFVPGEIPYSKWQIGSDCLHVSPGENTHIPEDYTRQSIEIATPAMSFARGQWQPEIHAALRILEWISETYECQFLVNKTTGLHVHIGNNFGEKLPLSTVKKVLQFATAFESRLDEIHAANRVRAPELDVAPFNLNYELDEIPLYTPLSFFHHQRDTVCTQGGGDIFSWVQRIERLDTYEKLSEFYLVELNDILLDGHHCTLNVDNMWADPRSARHEENLTNTIEFRQHTGTLDVIEILAYVSMLASIVDYCDRVTDVDFLTLLSCATNTSFGLLDLLNAVGCHSDVIGHFHCDNTAPIGMLPSSVPSRFRLRLEGLIDQNDDEQTANFDSTAIRISEKYKNWYYGVDPAMNGSFLDAEQIQSMNQQLYAIYQAEYRGLDEALQARVREEMLKALRLAYRTST